MTVMEVLKQRLSPNLHPWADKYGEAMLAMTPEQTLAWIDLVAAGKVLDAYQAVVAHMGNEELIAEWHAIAKSWAAGMANQASLQAAQVQAVTIIVRALLLIAMAALGG